MSTRRLLQTVAWDFPNPYVETDLELRFASDGLGLGPRLLILQGIEPGELWLPWWTRPSFIELRLGDERTVPVTVYPLPPVWQGAGGYGSDWLINGQPNVVLTRPGQGLRLIPRPTGWLALNPDVIVP